MHHTTAFVVSQSVTWVRALRLLPELLAIAALYPIGSLLRRHIRKARKRQRQSAIVESTDDAILCVSVDGKISSWNPAAQRMFGYTAEEVVGRDLAVLVPPELPEERNRLLQQV